MVMSMTMVASGFRCAENIAVVVLDKRSETAAGIITCSITEDVNKTTGHVRPIVPERHDIAM